jgi:flagellar hook-length control protein FliK
MRLAFFGAFIHRKRMNTMADITLLSPATPPVPSASPAAENTGAADATTASTPSTFATTLKEKIDQPASRETRETDPASDNPAAANLAVALSGMAVPTPPAAMPLLAAGHAPNEADPAGLIARLTASLATMTQDAQPTTQVAALSANAVSPTPTFPANIAKATGLDDKTAATESPATATPVADHAAKRALTIEQLFSHDKTAAEAAISAAPGTAVAAREFHADTVTPAAPALNAAALAVPMPPTENRAVSASPVQPQSLPGSPGQAGWADELGQRLTWMIGNHRQQADLVLSPPRLGHLEVSLKLDGDNASASFISPHPTVRTALEDALPRLREILSQSGITLGQTHVGSEQRQSSNGEQPAAGFVARASHDYPASISVASTASNLIRPGLRGLGMVDTFA